MNTMRKIVYVFLYMGWEKGHQLETNSQAKDQRGLEPKGYHDNGSGCVNKQTNSYLGSWMRREYIRNHSQGGNIAMF